MNEQVVNEQAKKLWDDYVKNFQAVFSAGMEETKAYLKKHHEETERLFNERKVSLG